MLKKITLLAVALTLLLSACTRSASPTQKPATNQSKATPTIGLNIPAAAGEDDLATPISATQQGMGLIEQLATQTALAGGGQPAAEQPTSLSGETATPDPLVIPTIGPSPTPAAPATSTPLPAPNTGTAQATVSVVAPNSYTVHGGEFVYCIARRYNLNPDEIMSLNGVGDDLYAGQTLKLPSTGSPFPGDRALKAHPATYTVTAGDTFYSIACQYGDISPENIARANGMSVDAALTAGTTIQIP
jgi:LysM repeat protein